MSKLNIINNELRGFSDDAYLQDVFGPSGYLSKKVPGYRPRPGQLRLSKTIHESIVSQGHVIAEGPTGTGKSLAYCVPAVHAARHGKKTVIVTGNIALQEQIANKDLVELADAVPWNFSFAVRKGISHYLCMKKVEDRSYKEVLEQKDLSSEELEKARDIVEWSETTRSGDKEDLPGGVTDDVWRAFTASQDDCDKHKCAFFYDGCHMKRAKDIAMESNIVITNYTMFFIQMMMDKQGSAGRVIPDWDIAILDEAHRASDHARDAFGDEIGIFSVFRAISYLSNLRVAGNKKEAGELRDKCRKEAMKLWTIFQQRIDAKQTIIEDTVPVEIMCKLLVEVHDLYQRESKALGGVTEAKDTGGAERSSHASKAEQRAERCKKLIENLLELKKPRKGIVYYIDGTESSSQPRDHKVWPKVKSKAIDVSSFMSNWVFGERVWTTEEDGEPVEHRKKRTVVMTSATLAIAGKGGSFGFLKKEVGLNFHKGVRDVTVESPFNWKANGLLVIPQDLPMYSSDNEEEWEDRVFAAMHRSIMLSRGRTLCLFSATSRMRKCAKYLRRKKMPYSVYVQRESTVKQLKSKFIEDNSSVLLGSTSFAEGFDVRGDACVSVIVDKIPFPGRGDPVVHGLKKMGKDWWNQYALPKGVIDFKQRVGRLIRTETDAGVVVCMDTRILPPAMGGNGYAGTFLGSVPNMARAYELEAVERFLKKKGRL
jgi:ATP-dependent DNA helicase DinG